MATQTIPITSREQWLLLRRDDVTASQIGALFGDDCHPYRTIASLHAEKSGIDIPGPDPDNEVIERGTELEPFVAAKVAKLRPEWAVTKADHYLRDPDARIGCTPDYYIDGPRGRGVLQCKTVGSGVFRAKWGERDAPRPPLWITLQLATEMMLAGCEYGAVGALVVGDYSWRLHIIEVERVEWAEVRLRDTVAAFWAAIAAGTPPQINPARDADLVRLLYPEVRKDSIIDLSADNRVRELLEDREAAAEIIKTAEAQKKAAETELLDKIADHEVALVPGWRVRLQTIKRKEFIQRATSYSRLYVTRDEAA